MGKFQVEAEVRRFHDTRSGRCNLTSEKGDPWNITNPQLLLISYIWVNHNISLIWIVRPFGDDFPKNKPWFQGSGEQWGRDEIYPYYIYM